MTKPFFREQAVEHASVKQYGTVILSDFAPNWILVILYAAAVAAIICFFAFFSTTRKAQAQGVLLPSEGVIRILPAQAGLIVDQRVQEGQSVKAGEVLFVINGDRSSGASVAPQKLISERMLDRRESYESEIRQLDGQASQRAAAAAVKVTQLERELRRTADQIALQRQRVVISEESLARYSDLQATNFISFAQLQDRKADVLDQKQRLADMLRLEAVAERDLSTGRAEMADIKAQANRDAAALRRGAFAVDQDLTDSEARRELFVRAPRGGVVTAITANVGQAVSTSQPLATILPAGAELEAEVYVPSRSAGFVRDGMPVLLRYQSFPYQKFGQHQATVKSVSSTSVRADELMANGSVPQVSPQSEPMYRIRLKLVRQGVLAYGQVVPLKSGMLIDASIQLESRRLYEWILEPLFSVSGRI